MFCTDTSLSDRMHLDWRSLLVDLSPDVSRELINSMSSLTRCALRDDPIQEDGSLSSAPVAGDAIEFCCDGPKLISMVRQLFPLILGCFLYLLLRLVEEESFLLQNPMQKLFIN